MNEIARMLLVVAGTLSVVLGVAGMFLPLLPTTPFLLLAAFCYGRSSERFYQMLLDNRWCGAYIRNCREGRGITLRQKAVAISVLWVSIGNTMWFVGSAMWVKLLLACLASVITLFLVRLKTYKPEAEI